MIYESLTCLANELNEFFRIKLKITEDKVIISALINLDGSTAISGGNKIVLTLQNIEKESAQTNSLNIGRSLIGGGQPMNINLYILISAYFPGSNYAESLKFISYIIMFLQNKNVFTHANTPMLDKGIDKLIFEIDNVGMDLQNNLWSTLGAKYIPSILVKMRTLTFDSTTINEIKPSVSGINNIAD